MLNTENAAPDPSSQEHEPLARHERSRNQKALAWALGFATVTTLLNMADREGKAIYEELSGHSEFATVQEYADHQGDPLDAMTHQSEDKNKHSQHSDSSGENPLDTMREGERPDFTDLARVAARDPNAPLLPDDFPRTKLPIHIDINTPKDAAKKQLVNH